MFHLSFMLVLFALSLGESTKQPLSRFMVNRTVGAAVVESSYSKKHQYVFLDPPEQFVPAMQVVGGYCQFDGRFLILLRSPQKPQGNTWCAPGGKLEKGETADQALIRELKEEIGLDVSALPLDYCRSVYVRFPHIDFILHLYRIQLGELPDLKIASAEHRGYCWVTPDEAFCLPLIPGGEECVALVFGKMPLITSCGLLQSTP